MNAASEIGGYLELERYAGSLYHDDAVALNCCRGCLAYVAELRGFSRIWVPDFMCDCVPALFGREGVEVSNYRIGPDLLPVYDFSVGASDWMLLCDYYGQLRAEDVERAALHCGGRLIVDETQGFFREPWPQADTVYSCRKWFGVPDGGFLATKDGAKLDRRLPRDESRNRMSFVLGRRERPAAEFYGEASLNNESFDAEPAKAMSTITESLMRAIDFDAARSKRVANFERLHGALAGRNLLRLRIPEAPFMYPYVVEDAGDTRRELAKKGIYIPMLWPNVPDDPCAGPVAISYSRNILPLSIDQRYGERDMEMITEVLKRCLK